MRSSLSALVAALVAAAVGGDSSRHRVQIHPLHVSSPIHAATETPACKGSCKMTYYGGKVLANVKVYQVNWSSAVDSAVAGALPGFYRAVTNSSYLDWLSEYDTNVAVGGGSHLGANGTNQKIGRGTFAGSFTISPSISGNQLTDAQIIAELDAQVTAGHLPAPDDNSVFVTYFPAGISIDDGSGALSCVKFCAYHSTYARGAQSVAYAVIPDHGPGTGCDLGCGNGTVLENTTDSISHEVVESITDFEVGLDTSNNYDYPAAWGNNANGEIGDMCSKSDLVSGEGDATQYAVQLIYSNSKNLCISSNLAAQDFKVFMKPNIASLTQGSSVVVPVSTGTTSGAAQALTLTVSGLPAGVTGSFDSTSLSSGGGAQLKLIASATAAKAKDAVVVVTAAGAVTHTAALLLQVTAATAANDFTVAVTPSSQSIAAGGVATYTVNTNVASGTAESVALSVSGLPTGVTGDFTSPTVTAGAGTTLTLNIDAAAAPVSGATFTVKGVSTSATHTAAGHLTITPAGTVNTFSLTLAPDTRSLLPGASATYTATTAVTGGAAEDIALAVADLPVGVTGAFSPASVKTGGTSTLTLTAAASAPAASATTFTVTGTAASDQQTVTADVTVLAGDFSLSITPAKASVAPGQDSTFTVATAIASGAPGSITLSVSGLPAGVTGAFDMDVLDAGQSAVLTLSAASSAAAAGPTTFTVDGVDGDGLQHSATAQLSVSGNDFSITLTPAAGTARRGDSASFNIASTITSGSAETIALAASGLPAGVTAQFSPSSISAGQPSVLVLSASSTAPLVASADVTVAATSASAQHTATVKVTVIDAPALPAVSIDAPKDGASVSGIVPIHATATPPANAALARIDLLFDGQMRWFSTQSPATVAWDTTQETNGPHSIAMRATDADGAVATAAAITVTVSNAAASSGGSSKGGCASGGGGALALLGLVAAFARRRSTSSRGTARRLSPTPGPSATP